MGLKYPEPVGPHSQTAVLAWLFGALGNAYSMLDQYEQQEEERERQCMRESLDQVYNRTKERRSQREDDETC